MTEFCCFKKTLFKLFSIWFDVGKNSGEINKEAYRETILKIVKTPTIIAWKKWHRKKDNIHLYLLLFLSTFLYINVAFSFYLRISAKTSSSTFDYLSIWLSINRNCMCYSTIFNVSSLTHSSRCRSILSEQRSFKSSVIWKQPIVHALSALKGCQNQVRMLIIAQQSLQ